MYDTLTTLLELIQKSNQQINVTIDFKNDKLMVITETKNYIYNINHKQLSFAIEELEPII